MNKKIKLIPILVVMMVNLLPQTTVLAQEKQENNYIQDTFTVESIEPQMAMRASAIPTTYDSRTTGVLPLVADQGDTGICWSYSAMSQANSSLIRKNVYNSQSPRLSANHFAYYFYQLFQDPLGNATGDGNVSMVTSGDYLSKGGNHMFSTFTLANWTGAAKDTGDITTISATDDEAHLQNAYWINFTDVNDVKQAVIDYGMVAMAYYQAPAYYNEDTNSYYNPTVVTTNHSVNIVGWDDNYSATNFNTTPAGDGAWLVQNSMGTEYGDNGYFWISYYDNAFNRATSKAFVFDFESADNYDCNYQYDGSGAVATTYMNNDEADYQVQNGGSIANVYQMSEEAETTVESLEAVSMALSSTNVSYSIQIYKNPTDESIPTSGEMMLHTPVTGSTTYTGYYTIPLTQKIELQRGDTFAVVITLRSNDGSPITYLADESCTNGNWIQFVNQTNEGQSFRNVDGASWQDMNTIDHYGDGNGMTIRIKAFTNQIEDMTEIEEVDLSKNPNTENQDEEIDETFGTAKEESITTVPKTGDTKVVEYMVLVMILAGAIFVNIRVSKH